MECFKSALTMKCEHGLKVTLQSNIAQCYINLAMFEDALQYSNLALETDPDHSKSLYRKAKSLAYLLEFEESSTIFKQINQEKEIEEFVNRLKA